MNDVITAPAPDDEPTPEEIAAAGTIRPIDDIPSPWIVKGTPAILSAPTLSALSPDDQKAVRERAGSTDERAIQSALTEFLKDRQRDFRIRCGPGEGATETERTALSQANELRLLADEQSRIEAELAEVWDHRTEIGPDGNPVAVPVYRHQGDARAAREARLEQIVYQAALVAGIEGDKELNAARRADALKARAVRQQTAERDEIKRMGAALIREERVKKGAEAYAKFHRPNLN